MENCRFPNKLKKYRRLFQFSQKYVAALLGLKDSSLISRWEKGVAHPGLLNLFRLSRIYKALPTEMYLDIWQSISKEILSKEMNLLAQHESLITNEKYYL